MFDLVAAGVALFKNMEEFSEAALEANATFLCTVSDLPTDNQLKEFLDSFCDVDDVALSIKSYLDFSYCRSNQTAWIADYNKFIESSEPKDSVTINIHIGKRVDDRGALSIYSFKYFIMHYTNLEFYALIQELSYALKRRNHLAFHVLDKEINLSTQTICFFNDVTMLTDFSLQRAHNLEKLHKLSLFLNRTEFPLMPNDFCILQNTSVDTSDLAHLFGKLETVFSYIYLAYSAYIVKNQVVLQLSPSAMNLNITFEEIKPCQHICDLFQWSFWGNGAAEKVGITRNLLALNCKKSSDLNLEDESILLSAKSNYILFQKKTVDKYIELKNSIAQTIVDATHNLEEILQSLVDAVRNNFVAVIMFLMTVIVTDTVNWENFFSERVLDSDVIHVIRVFCVASFFYLLTTLVGVFFKWSFFLHGYKALKNNYADILDAEDLERAFDGDNAVNFIKKRIIYASILVATVWIIVLCLLYSLVG